MEYDITFHPTWWNKHAGICFTEDFFTNPEIRINSDMVMRRTLFWKWGLGEEDPRPRPVLGSDLIASGFLYSEIMGCEVRYSEENPPEVLCANPFSRMPWESRIPPVLIPEGKRSWWWNMAGLDWSKLVHSILRGKKDIE
jgi:hypothetical protein